MPIVLKKAQGKMTVTIQKKSDPEPTKVEETVGLPMVMPEPHARVGVSGARKFTDGNYGNFSVGCWVELPCLPNDAAVCQALAEAEGHVDNKLKEMLEGTSAKPGE